VRTWQAILVSVVTVDVESADTIHAFELLEAIEGHFTGAGDELQQFGAFFFIE
jgi:hypothetical protein